MSAHHFELSSIDGETLSLSAYAGKPVLLVNTASECAYTPQYAGLQALWQRYRAHGLVVLGVPSNDFGAQEPGAEAAIKMFCRERYAVDFPISAKQKVIGPEAHPLYRWIEQQLGEAGTPRWNFHKYLLDRDGELLEMWPAAVDPESDAIVAALEQVLGKP